MKIGDIEYPSLKGQVPAEEWQTRVELAAIFRLIPLLGWWDLTQAPAAARVAGQPDHFLVAPEGFLFEEITASSLVKITLDGEYAAPTPLTFMRSIWYPLQAVFAVRPDVNFAIHTHDEFGAALSARADKLLPVSQPGAFAIAGGVRYHVYDGVETYEERMASLQSSLGLQSLTMILHNHGLLTVHPTAYGAIFVMANLRRACEIQVLAGNGRDLMEIAPHVMPELEAELRRGPAVDNLWPGLLRKLDRMDPTYRD